MPLTDPWTLDGQTIPRYWCDPYCVYFVYDIIIEYNLRGNCTSNQKLACFVLYLKIVNTFFER